MQETDARRGEKFVDWYSALMRTTRRETMMGYHPAYLVFDVESVGLHGDHFAVGWCLLVFDGESYAKQSEGCAWCDYAQLDGTDSNREWVRANVPEMYIGNQVANQRAVRDAFWAAWEEARAMGAYMAADCVWPVEARFLSACVDDDHDAREWGGPYPLIDISTVLTCAGINPLVPTERFPSELPAHHPLADARQSARLLVHCIGILD